MPKQSVLDDFNTSSEADVTAFHATDRDLVVHENATQFLSLSEGSHKGNRLRVRAERFRVNRRKLIVKKAKKKFAKYNSDLDDVTDYDVVKELLEKTRRQYDGSPGLDNQKVSLKIRNFMISHDLF